MNFNSPKRALNAGYILPGSRFLEVEVVTPKLHVAGEYKIIKHRQGFVLQETPWFDNIILDAGLNRWGNNSIITGCGIGTGTSTPAVGQVGLDSESHWTTTTATGDGTTSVGISPNYNNTRTKVYRTTLGALNGNYSEVGVGWAAGPSKFSRALILDGGGSPTTITVGVAEQLDIWYRGSVYPPLVDTSNTIIISGVSYTITGRASDVTNINAWNAGIHGALNASPGAGGFHTYYGSGAALGAITGSPTGGSAQGAAIGESKSYAAYVNSSLQLDQTVAWGLDITNAPGGLQAVGIAHTTARFQYHFSPVIPKDNTKTLSMTYRYSWARRP